MSWMPLVIGAHPFFPSKRHLVHMLRNAPSCKLKLIKWGHYTGLSHKKVEFLLDHLTAQALHGCFFHGYFSFKSEIWFLLSDHGNQGLLILPKFTIQMCSISQDCDIRQSDPAWVQHGKCFVWWRVNVILLVGVILSWTCWMLANACIVFIYGKRHKNSLHHFLGVISFLWPSSCICICVHMCMYIQCASILLFLESCYYMLLT